MSSLKWKSIALVIAATGFSHLAFGDELPKVKTADLVRAFNIYVNFADKTCQRSKGTSERSFGEDLLKIGCKLDYYIPEQGLVYDCRQTTKGDLKFRVMAKNQEVCQDILKEFKNGDTAEKDTLKPATTSTSP